MGKAKILSLAILFMVISLHAKEIRLQNSETYSGCEDSYLSALYEDTTLINMVSDTLTNHSTEEQLHLSK